MALFYPWLLKCLWFPGPLSGRMNEFGLSRMGSAFCSPEWWVHSGQVRAGLGQREPLSAQVQGAGAGETRGSKAVPQIPGPGCRHQRWAMWFQQTTAQEDKASCTEGTIRTSPRVLLSGLILSNQSPDGLASVLRSQDEEPGQRAPGQRAEPPKRSCVSGDLI